MNQVICNAIRNRNVLKFTYHGHPRVVEPHAHGLTQEGHEALFYYQTGGTSGSDRGPFWSLMMVDQIESLTVTEERFVDVRSGYKKGGNRMSTIFCEIVTLR